MSGEHFVYKKMTKCEGNLHLFKGWPLYGRCQCERDKLMNGVKEFTLFFGLQFISYLNITLDYRAIAHQQYAVAAITNIVAPLVAWVMVQKIGEAKNKKLGMLAVASAGALSALLGMWLTRAWG